MIIFIVELIIAVVNIPINIFDIFNSFLLDIIINPSYYYIYNGK
jgi:hypothetical protein